MHDKDKQSNAFWAWAKCLGRVIFWAREPNAKTTTTAGWLEAVRSDIRDSGDLARDAAPDDVTRKQVIRSRSLALDLVRMLNQVPELNSVSYRTWPTTERIIVDDLAKLKSRFAELGDGEQRSEVESNLDQVVASVAVKAKTRRKTVSKTATRDKKFVAMADGRKSSKEIATWWNNHQTKETVSPESVRAAISRQRKRDKV